MARTDKDNPKSKYWARKCEAKVAPYGWPLWKVATHVMWNNACAFCGRTEGKLDAHHIMGRRPVIRYRPLNLILLCFQHHLGDSRCSAHGGGIALGVELCRKHPGLAAWIEHIRPRLYDPMFLKAWDWQSDHQMLRRIVDEHIRYEWVCGEIGLTTKTQRTQR